MNPPKILLLCGDCGVIPWMPGSSGLGSAMRHTDANPTHEVAVYNLDRTVVA